MAKNITTSDATTVVAGANSIRITVNAALTGTITVAAGSTTVATITDPGVGAEFNYGGLAGQGAVVITASTTCNITVSVTG